MPTKRLIGSDPNQVSLNGMLGRMAWLDPEALPPLRFSSGATAQLFSDDITLTNSNGTLSERTLPTQRAVRTYVDNEFVNLNTTLVFNVGTEPNETPVSGQLGRLAFIDEWCGYAQGGGVVAQDTSKSTGVTLNALCGQLTMHDESLAAGVAVSFTFTNDRIAPSDLLLVSIAGNATAGAYLVTTSQISAGSAAISLRNLSSSSLSEAVILNFLLVKSTTTLT
jgi:hypothetical protein